MLFLNKTVNSIEHAISRSPLKPIQKFKIIRSIEVTKKIMKSVARPGYYSIKDIPLLPSNVAYDHEKILKAYSGYSSPIYATIEHGVFLGDNVSSSMISFSEEFEMGSFITMGSYRKKLLEQEYPDHYVEAIGPYINYASIDKTFEQMLQGRLIPNKGTILFFCSHSTKKKSLQQSFDSIFNTVKSLAKKWDCENIMLCLHPYDYKSEVIQEAKSRGIIVVSAVGGLFLSRLKTILNNADFVASNAIGTHIGYALSQSKPVCLIDVDCNYDNLESGINRKVFKRQVHELIECFRVVASPEISEDQKAICDYYWGDSQLTPEALSEVFQKCKMHCEALG